MRSAKPGNHLKALFPEFLPDRSFSKVEKPWKQGCALSKGAQCTETVESKMPSI